MKAPYDIKIVHSYELHGYAQHFLEDFQKKEKSIIYPPLDIRLAFHPTKEAYSQDPKRSFDGPVFSEKKGEYFIIHLCEESLKDIPGLALQGLLAQEVSLCIQKLQPEFYNCNFRAKIYPLWPVIGLAENHMRELVNNLEISLKKYLATRLLIDLGFAISQVYMHFYLIHPNPEDRYHYQEAIPHHWSRALFLCRNLREFMSIFLLYRRSIQYSGDLNAWWLKAHDYMLPEDITLLKVLADIPEQLGEGLYSDKVAELFKRVKLRFLAPGRQPASPQTLH